MAFSKQQQKLVLIVLVAVLVLANVYRFVTSEKPKTAPLAYPRGAVAVAPVRSVVPTAAASSDPLTVFFARRQEPFPGVGRDLFRMENPAPKRKPAPVAPIVPALPTVPEKTPEEIAAEFAEADLSKFRFLGYLTDVDRSLFLSKDGETFIVKSGDRVLKNYKIKDAGKDYVILLDTVTQVEVRIELSGSGPEPAAPPHPQPQKFR
jgi:WD40 repeat protein